MILASATGKTRHGQLFYVITYEEPFHDRVELRRFLDEPITNKPDSENIILSIPILTMAYYAENMADPLFPIRRLSEEDYDYEVLSQCYKRFLWRIRAVLNFETLRESCELS